MFSFSGVRQRVKTGWFWLIGDLPEIEREQSNGLLWWMGVWIGLAMLLGTFHNLGGPPPSRGLWRMAAHGLVPLCGLSLWCSWKEGQRLGMVLAFVATVFVLTPFLAREYDPALTKVFKTQSIWLFGSFIPSFVFASVALYLGRIDLKYWGIGLGDWRWWLPRVAIVAGAMIPTILVVMMLDPQMAEFYPTWKPARNYVFKLYMLILSYLFDLAGWELLFRGLLLFLFARRGDALVAIWVQVFPFFLLHADKPYFELLTSFVGGLLSGWFCLRAGCFWPLFLLHWLQISWVSVVGFLLANSFI